jgi:peptidoglycan/LPS O-acetylase OafA/YrhL
MSQSQRLDYLDAVRAFALLLGVVFHAGLSFMPMFIGWAVMDISTSNFVPVFTVISHSFRMEVFFLVAGFFSHMTFHKKGVKTFLKERFIRIAIPFLIGWFLLRPLLVSGWVIGMQSMQGDVDIKLGLQQGLLSLQELPFNLLVGTHLWFLYYLLIFSAAVIVAREIMTRIPSVYTTVVAAADKAVNWLSLTPFAVLVAIVPIALCLWYMQNWGVDTPDKSLIPHLPATLLYGGFFSLGWLLERGNLISEFAKHSWIKLIVCLASIVAVIVLSPFEANPNDVNYSIYKTAFCVSYALMMWTLIGYTIALCKGLFAKPNKGVRYLADASYWIYLSHLPIVIFLQIAFAELEWLWWIKWIGISTLTLFVSLSLYALFVRSTLIGQTLNGMRKPRFSI